MTEYSYSSPLGNLILIAAGNSLVYCNWELPDCLFKLVKIRKLYKNCADCKSESDIIAETISQLDDYNCKSESDVIAETISQLDDYFTGKLKNFNLPLHFYGTPFQKAVWRGINEIPFGETLSYSELCDKIRRPGTQRAVARVCGANPLAVIIPCHRVVGKVGNLGGYTGGLDKKLYLLDLEIRHTPEQ